MNLIFILMIKTLIAGLFIIFLNYACAQAPAHKVIAYYTGNGETIRNYPVQKLTHIIYSFLKIQNDTLTFHNEQQRATLRQLVLLKKENPRLKVMVSIGGWGACAPCSDLFASAEHRRNFAGTTVALLKEYGADGLDLDWEYPAIEGFPGHKYDAADRDNFTALVKALREEMGGSYLLSFAAGGFTKYVNQSIDWDRVTPLVDFINLMTYDLVGGYSTVTGHHTPLDNYLPGQESVQNCVKLLLDKKVPAGKLIIGAAFYARVWKGVADTNHGLYQSGIFYRGVAFRDFKNFFSDSSGYKYYWDRKAKAPYRYNSSEKLFATFDDPRSIRKKTRFVRRNKLGGVMFWELSQDKNENGLVNAISRGLNR